MPLTVPKILAKHHEQDMPGWPVTICHGCGQDWLCETAVVLAALDDALHDAQHWEASYRLLLQTSGLSQREAA